MYSLGPGACSAQARGETTRYPLRSCSPQPAVGYSKPEDTHGMYRLYFGSRTVFFSSKIYISIDWLGGAPKKLSGLLARWQQYRGTERPSLARRAVNAGPVVSSTPTAGVLKITNATAAEISASRPGPKMTRRAISWRRQLNFTTTTNQQTTTSQADTVGDGETIMLDLDLVARST